jgi:hypothetical protein
MGAECIGGGKGVIEFLGESSWVLIMKLLPCFAEKCKYIRTGLVGLDGEGRK